MRRMLLGLGLCALMAGPILAATTPTLEYYGAAGASVSGWTFDAATKVFTFGASPVAGVYGGTTDVLVGAGYVNIPDMTLGGSAGAWTLPGGTITISDDTGTIDYLVGTLGAGDLDPMGTGGDAYTAFQTDITWTSKHNTISSPVIDAMYADPRLADFHLVMTISGTDFADMLVTSSGSYGDGLSGSVHVVPAPAALLLAGIGAGLVGWLRRRKTV